VGAARVVVSGNENVTWAGGLRGGGGGRGIFLRMEGRGGQQEAGPGAAVGRVRHPVAGRLA
jgi:hypothetical protein